MALYAMCSELGMLCCVLYSEPEMRVGGESRQGYRFIFIAITFPLRLALYASPFSTILPLLLSFSLPQSLPISLSLPTSLSLSLFLSPSPLPLPILSPSLYLPLPLPLSVFHSVSPLSFSLYLSISLPLFLSLPLTLSLTIPLPPSTCRFRSWMAI